MTSIVSAGEGSLRSLYRYYSHLLTAERDAQGAILSSRGFGRYVPNPNVLQAARLAGGSFEEFRAAVINRAEGTVSNANSPNSGAIKKALLVNAELHPPTGSLRC